MALLAGLCVSICFKYACITSRQDTCLLWMALDKASADILGMTMRLFFFQRSIVGVFSSLTILNLELPSYL